MGVVKILVSLAVGKKAGSVLRGHFNVECATLLALGLRALLGVKVVLAGFASDNLATLRHAEPLRVGFVGFHIISFRTFQGP